MLPAKSERILLGPGPSLMSPRVMQALAQPMLSHLDPPFVEIMDDVRARLARVFQAPPGSFAFAVSGTGTAAMETAVANLIAPGTRVLSVVTGYFADRLAQMATRYGGDVTRVEAEWGRAIDPDQVRQALKAAAADVVTIVHAETSTGVLNPVQSVAAIAREAGALVMVDAVTSLGGMPLDVAGWDLDAVYSCSQKCLGAPSGMSPIVFSPRALAKKVACRSFYFDVMLLEDYWVRRKYHHTMSASLVYALQAALAGVEEEGLQARWGRHQRHHLAFVAALDRIGLTLLPREGERLWTLNAVAVPQGVDDAAVRKYLLQNCNIEIGGGLGPLAGKVFRVGLMGTSSSQELVDLLSDALQKAINQVVRGCTERYMRQGRYLLLGIVLSASAACATNPVTGKNQISLLSEAEELAIGQQQDVEVRREMGVYDDPELQRYVNDIGTELARRSHRPNLPWTFTIVDSPAINAFALPGGYVYLTRGLMAYLDDESELAGVLGHEIGHVTARHAAQAYTRQAETNIGLMILGIFVPSTQPFTDLGATGLSVLFLKNGREAELEADRLGVEYGSGGGYDPTGVPRFLSTLARVDALSERGVPNWLSTHPDPGSRVQKAEPIVGKFVSADAKTVNHEQYLEHIQGLVFGDSPKDGIVRGNEFVHPLLRIAMKFPEGWELTNAPQAVMAQEPGTQHFMVLQEVDRQATTRQSSGNQATSQAIAEIALAAMRRAGYTPVDGSYERINGQEAYLGLYRGNAKDVGKVTMRAAHIAIGRQLYVAAGFAPEKEFDLVDRDIQRSLKTFRQLTPVEASNVRPNRLQFYVVRQGDSWQSIAARQAKGFVNAATLAIMNDREVSVQPQSGERIKIVVEG